MRRLFSVISLVSALAVAPAPAARARQADVNPAVLAQQEIAAERAGNVDAALAFYEDDAVVQGGGLCWTPCIGKAAIRRELERRIAAKNDPVVAAKFASNGVAVIETDVALSYTDKTGTRRNLQWSPGVDRVVVWNIFQTKDGKIAAVTLIGQRTDPQTARFIEWSQSFARK